MWDKIQTSLEKIYTKEETASTVDDIKNLISDFKSKLTPAKAKKISTKFNLTPADIALVTYANSMKEGNVKTLKVLNKFINKYKISKALNTVHILPFYPWDTDRGFSVTDYYKVDPDHGNWNDIKKLAKSVYLMFDFVANHASVENLLVQSSLIERHLDKNDRYYKKYKRYKDFVIAYSDKDKPTKDELKKLARPRPNPILTPYFIQNNKLNTLKAVLGKPSGEDKILGSGYVWTTFSRPKKADGSEDTRQVDLNFANPKVLVETIKILLFYVLDGARLIRLDAVAYLWKKLGSTSIHEPETHLILEIIHDIMALAAPGVITIAEVNEPQDKVHRYLGKKDHVESDLIYQFTHYPLAIYAVLTGNGKPYMNWLKTLPKFGGKQFISVMGTHDGMGLKPVLGFLSESQINKLIDILVKRHHALPNYAKLSGGKKIVYEICATPWNLINESLSKEKLSLQVDRYLAVLALGLMIRGLPAIYINGLIGAPNYYPKEGLDENRTVNREIFDYTKLKESLDNQKSQMGAAFKRVMEILKIRSEEKLFDPDYPPTTLIDLGNKSVIAAILTDPQKNKSLYALVNVSNKTQSVELKSQNEKLTDLINIREYVTKNGNLQIGLKPYQVLWLK
jgi:sucrose phosphorylase